jgi:hypothetical protein
MKPGFEKGGYGLVAGGPRLHSMGLHQCVHADDARSIRAQATGMGRKEMGFFFFSAPVHLSLLKNIAAQLSVHDMYRTPQKSLFRP